MFELTRKNLTTMDFLAYVWATDRASIITIAHTEAQSLWPGSSRNVRSEANSRGGSGG